MTEVNTVFPYQPGYQRADRADDYQPGSVTARAITADGSAVAQAHIVMSHARREHKKFLDTVKQHRDRFSDQGYREQVQMFADTDAARAVGNAVEQVQQRRDQAQTHLDKLRADLAPDGDTAAELRATRFWERTRRILDNTDAGEVSQAARDFIGKANRSELATLVQELGPYCESRGHSCEWMDAALAQAVPEYGAAQAELAKADQALTITKYNAETLARGFSEGRPPTVIVDPSDYDPDR